MFGAQKDIEDECNAKLYIGDDHGDGRATMRCQLKPGHEGLHQERYDAGYGETNWVTITWERDEEEDELREEKELEDEKEE